jgi:hypothetical protein
MWSDEEFYIYLNDAQDTFVRAVGGIADRRSAMTKIKYKAGDQFRDYDDRIIRIKNVHDELNTNIEVQNLDSLSENMLWNDYGTRVRSGLDDSLVGPIQYVINDVESNSLQLYPIPDRDGYLRLYVYRRPLDEVTSGSTALEIPSFQHYNLLNWVKYRAFMKQDVEAFDGTKASEFRKAFQDGVADAKDLKSSREDRKRIMSYGGI